MVPNYQQKAKFILYYYIEVAYQDAYSHFPVSLYITVLLYLRHYVNILRNVANL